ncbi:MAG: hypothetical protein KKH68_12735, partial [Proteobacteria bacterium]|nr:hypothetical protein [Pseudomonadota bacterium]
SIIADFETYTSTKTGQMLYLGDMARSVCGQINKKITEPGHYFHFNNHRTAEDSTLNKEQRKSATYYALTTCGIPAFGIETSKSLPLEHKVRHHNLAVNAFMERMGIVPETPGLNLERPVLNYLVASINDSLPVVVRDQQYLSINPGDSIMISHIEANYERGLSVDIIGYGAANDIRKKIKIEGPTKVIVRKDYHPCGQIDIKLGQNQKDTPPGIGVADKPVLGPGLFLYRVRINGDERIFQNYAHVKLVKGDKFEIVDIISGMGNPSAFVVNLKGFVGTTRNNTGEDRGYVIDTGRDLWQRYSLERKGKIYQVVVTDDREVIGKLFLDLEDPVLKYIVLNTEDRKMRCLVPGDMICVKPGTPVQLFDINTNVQHNVNVKAFIAGPGSLRRPLNIAESIAVDSIFNANGNNVSGEYRIEIEWDKIPLGSVILNCLQETPREK